MRKETKKICQAFIDGREAHAARTKTNGIILFLHDNPIAQWHVDESGKVNRNILHICFCGWASTTTKERINGLLYLLGFGRPFFTRDFQLYFGNELRPVDSYETITLDIALMRELSNDNTITPKQIAA